MISELCAEKITAIMEYKKTIGKSLIIVIFNRESKVAGSEK